MLKEWILCEFSGLQDAGSKQKTEMVAFGDRSTSDLVVRLRTNEGRDNWLYCHSKVLVEKSKYFAERLSEDWPTCQIIDSRNCVEVFCKEPDFNSHVIALGLLYLKGRQKWYGVRNALGILQAAIHLGCHQMASDCTEYMEAVPWDEADEDEILRTVPTLGPEYQHILARLHPAVQNSLAKIFVPAINFATSSPHPSLTELKTSTQEQLEYLLTEDDDPPLFTLEDEFIRSSVKHSVKSLLSKFDSLVISLSASSVVSIPDTTINEMHSHLCDISWACQVLTKMEMMKDLVHYWVEASANVLSAAKHVKPISDEVDIEIKIVEVTAKVLETIGFGNAIVPTESRIRMVKLWLPFVQRVKVLVEQDSSNSKEKEAAMAVVKLDAEVWQGLESAFVSIILTLPSSVQADILSDWLRSECVGYPDLTEAFELWCYRTKVARRRLAAIASSPKDA